jgi:catechol 2,3-dioxygenase-like lactoylglutathione lyase family enzyme
VGDNGIFQRVDAVTVPVPDLDTGLRFYRDKLGHRLLWRNDTVGQAGLALPVGDSELVLTTRQEYEPNWLVADVPDCVDAMVRSGGRVVVAPVEIPVGRAAVLADPFGNRLVVVDLSKGRYRGDGSLPTGADRS